MPSQIVRGARIEWDCPKCKFRNFSSRVTFLVCALCEATFDKLPLAANKEPANVLQTVIEHRKALAQDSQDHERRRKVMAQAQGLNEEGWVIVGSVGRFRCSNCGTLRYDDGTACNVCRARTKNENDLTDGDRM